MNAYRMNLIEPKETNKIKNTRAFQLKLNFFFQNYQFDYGHYVEVTQGVIVAESNKFLGTRKCELDLLD